MKKKILLRIFPIGLILGVIIFFETKSYLERKHFFASKMNTVVIEIKSNWSGGRSYNYLTKDNSVITLLNSDSFNLKLKDSIVKKSNSWEFYVFRVGAFTPEYMFYKKYDYKKF